ncbi:hypothetical protein ORI89_15440 [Sphingobacterium sp. UT-1RO-CII-1]|uniref:MauE/DoxX family redox-associated membrane protein n=1 Tax=Sphingobacterium sp. UT-1RO-CII-1 TaxID=2995225 RepID=UPI00227C7325|nr:MauE/DoxX family redox-associated membrane protein [Sphingobacterium sp. UT-1RO-CII-1]MCY4781053.1 hypothetical protein [Sphingobacterium sp. UT-1RO-CII-1]
MNKKIIKYSPYIFILLWGYAAIVKLYNWDSSRREMQLQIFPGWLANILFWFIPLLGLIVAGLLIQRRTTLIGIKTSVGLLGLFTLYLALGAAKVFGKVPCACGGILNNASHIEHIFFNIAFIALGIYTWILASRSLPVGDVQTDAGRREGSKNQ